MPIAAYGMSLTYNCSLFTQAGPRPDQAAHDVGRGPRGRQDDRREDRRRRLRRDGQLENTGGWQLTTSTYALGGRMETVGSDGKVTATVNNPQTKQVLERLKALRWDDNSHGLHVRLRLGLDQPGVLLRPDRHVHRRLRPVHRDGPEQRHQARGLLRTVIPLDDAPDAGVLGGGTLAAVNVVTNDAQRDAAVDWIDFYYMQKLLTQDGAVADAEALKANNQPVGVPSLPIFDKATYDAVPGVDQGLHQRPAPPRWRRSPRRSSTSRS